MISSNSRHGAGRTSGQMVADQKKQFLKDLYKCMRIMKIENFTIVHNLSHGN